MAIKGCETIAEYKAARDQRIQQWIDDNFITGSVTWELAGALQVKITDRTGDTMMMPLERML